MTDNAELTVSFTELYGTAPEGIWAAPGRVNLIGEYTDFNGGFVMPLALPHHARAAVARRTDGQLRLHSTDVPGGVVSLRVDELAPHSGHGWAAYPAGVVWALREAGHQVTGADIQLTSTVPVGAGLSSSAALEVVTALALNDLFELGLGAQEVAVLAQRAENDFVGVPCGVMDQMASACCTEGHALYLDTRDLTQRQSPSTSPRTGCSCSSSTPASSTPSATARTPSAGPAARPEPGPSASTCCATSRTRTSAPRWRPSRRPARTSRSCATSATW